MTIHRGRRLGAGVALLAAVLLGLLAACGGEKTDVGPDVEGSTLLEAEGILVAWCENVRVVIDPEVALDRVDPTQIRVSRQYTELTDPDLPPPPGTLRPGWALEPPPSTPASTSSAPTTPAASSAPPTSAAPTTSRADATPTAAPSTVESSSGVNGLLGALTAPEEPPATDPCRSGDIPTAYLSLEAEVPDLAGVPVQEAIALLGQRGIVVEAPPVHDPAALVGTQSLPAGTIVPLGVTGQGPALEVLPADVPVGVVLVEVPDVAHLPVNAGCAILRSEGFECSILTVSGDIEFEPDWEIVSQWPRIPTRAAEGATVKVVVVGPTFAVVPNVVNMPYATACDILRDSHLICAVSGDLGKREVAAQSPVAGATVTPGVAVALQFHPVPWYETWTGRLALLFAGGVVTALGGLLVRVAFGGRRRRARPVRR